VIPLIPPSPKGRGVREKEERCSILLDVLLSILGYKQVYLDPGSGSFLLQLQIAGLLGAALVLRTQWSKIKKFFNRKNVIKETKDEDSDEA
jgi:uncharacterized membrane protein HdeD (DUF308 family)